MCVYVRGGIKAVRTDDSVRVFCMCVYVHYVHRGHVSASKCGVCVCVPMYSDMSIQYMLACAYMYVCVSLCIYMHVWACVHVCKSVCVCLCLYSCVCLYA